MSEEKIKSIMREFVEATAKGDVDKAISFVLTMWSGSSPKVHSKERMR